jgi:xanthine dehydrogenase accessory factor
MNIEGLFSCIIKKTEAGEDTVLATIVADMGSSPRSAGSHMLVDANGLCAGTIGGGTVEYRAIEYARKVLAEGRSDRKTYRLYKNAEEDLGMVCGGEVDVYFCFIKGDSTPAPFFRECVLKLKEDENLWLAMDLTDIARTDMALYDSA